MRAAAVAEGVLYPHTAAPFQALCPACARPSRRKICKEVLRTRKDTRKDADRCAHVCTHVRTQTIIPIRICVRPRMHRRQTWTRFAVALASHSARRGLHWQQSQASPACVRTRASRAYAALGRTESRTRPCIPSQRPFKLKDASPRPPFPIRIAALHYGGFNGNLRCRRLGGAHRSTFSAGRMRRGRCPSPACL